MDFYFNGHYLSEFGGYVGSRDGGLKSYPLLPSRSYSTDHAIDQDGETIYSSRLEPRPFEVPVVFEDLSETGLRKIAGWLNSPAPSKFFYRDEELFINCVLDTDAFNAETSCGVDGQIPLKFIAHDPYYYSRTDFTHVWSTVPLNTPIQMHCDANVICFPFMKIKGTKDITITILGHDNKGDVVRNVTNIKNCVTGVNINTKTKDCLSLSGEYFSGNIDNFPIIPSGDYTITFSTTGTLTEVSMTYKERYI